LFRITRVVLQVNIFLGGIVFYLKKQGKDTGIYKSRVQVGSVLKGESQPGVVRLRKGNYFGVVQRIVGLNQFGSIAGEK